MHRWDRLVLLMKENGLDELVFASQHAIRYLTGFAPDLEMGPNAFDPGPAVLRIEREGDRLEGVLLAAHGAEESVSVPWVRCVLYENYNVETLGFDRLNAYQAALGEWAQTGLRARTGSRSGTLVSAAERGFLPAAVSEALAVDSTAADCTPLLNEVRRVKDSDELAALRAAVRLANVGQQAARRHAREGLAEIECYGLVKAEIEKAAGKRVPLLADFVSGPKTANIGGPPSDRLLFKGDLLLTDMVPHLDGYWGDSCSVTPIGKPSARALGVWKHVKEALELAKSSIKPGVRVSETDRIVRDYLRKQMLPAYPHHTGHGLGIQWHESPLISANGDGVYEENMVVAVEPGVYLPDEGFGIRLEDVGRVTAGGFEQWTAYDLELE